MLAGLLVLVGLSAVLGVLLTLLARRGGAGDDQDVDAVCALLPQIQCAQCGYPGCRPYAEAIVRELAPLNLCPPGGEQTTQALARLLDREVGATPTQGTFRPGTVARIDEAACIGCARCLPACPVDAIVGAPRFMHTVIAAECTGCQLCLPACPVDCISMEAQ
ncbi:MAG: RnfABCDGE type electron transport complex subunit B [Chromatiales bacterium]|nr:RnfABCDGE type electron transport complex subunit B [Chromatiales bacterium]